MHHMGVYETYVVLKDSEQLAQKQQLKLSTTLSLLCPQGSKNGALKTSLCCNRAHWYVMGLLDLEKMQRNFK